MSIGTTILELMGRQDPRTRLLQAIAGQAGDPYASAATQGAATSIAGDQQDAPRTASQPQQADIYNSPNDLQDMYKELLNYSSRAQNIDRGIGLLGAAFAHPENRGAILQTFAGDRSAYPNTDPAALASTIMEINRARAASQQQAATMASLPLIAQKYGIDMQTATMLLQSGKLDEFIHEREKAMYENSNRPRQFMQQDGQIYSVDPNSNTAEVIAGQPKPEKLEFREVNGKIVGFDPITGEQKAEYGVGDPNLKFVKDEATGETIVVNRMGAEVGRLGGLKDDRTNLQKDYEAYVKDWAKNQESGVIQEPLKTFEQWRLSKPADTSVTVNVGTDNADQRKKKFNEKAGELDAKMYEDITNAANSAIQASAQYDLAEQALNTGFRTGIAADAEINLRKFLLAIGYSGDVEKLKGADLFKSIQNQLAMIKRNPDSGMGLPGAVSDKDIQFLKESDINVGATPEANRMMIEVARRLNQRKVEIAKLADEYVEQHGELGPGFRRKLKEWAEANPLFADLSSAPVDPDVQSLVDKWRRK